MASQSSGGSQGPRGSTAPRFAGFPAFRSNVLFCPKQVFTMLHPHCSVGCIRLVDFMVRQALGWVVERAEPVQEQLRFTYEQLEREARVGHSSLRKALAEATDR